MKAEFLSTLRIPSDSCESLPPDRGHARAGSSGIYFIGLTTQGGNINKGDSMLLISVLESFRCRKFKTWELWVFAFKIYVFQNISTSRCSKSLFNLNSVKNRNVFMEKERSLHSLLNILCMILKCKKKQSLYFPLKWKPLAEAFVIHGKFRRKDLFHYEPTFLKGRYNVFLKTLDIIINLIHWVI